MLGKSAPGLRFPPYPAGPRSGGSCKGGGVPDSRSEKCAPRKKPHANARAANAFAVTVVIGVLVMAGAFPGVWLKVTEVYASAALMRNTPERH